jgi:16S rRNA (cytidine1402-2'-O)-methyltransferase
MSKLYIVPTPVGNLEDITLRAIRILKESNLILAEDTRNTSNLLKHFGISNKLQSYHAFNEHKITEQIVDKILSGTTIALVSDAGTPGISDPGYFIVRECIKSNIEVECLPGATAFVPALINSGFPSDSFCFEGFLPHKKGRQSKLLELAQEKRTIILYESPFRLLKTLQQLKDFFGADREVSVSRELTKVYEENVRGSVEFVMEHFTKKPSIKGEIVIVIKGLS